MGVRVACEKSESLKAREIELGCRPECGWNLRGVVSEHGEAIGSSGEVNRLIDWVGCEGLPSIDLAHVDLT